MSKRLSYSSLRLFSISIRSSYCSCSRLISSSSLRRLPYSTNLQYILLSTSRSMTDARIKQLPLGALSFRHLIIFILISTGEGVLSHLAPIFQSLMPSNRRFSFSLSLWKGLIFLIYDREMPSFESICSFTLVLRRPYSLVSARSRSRALNY